MRKKPAKRQIRLMIGSNAGGSGKTTLAVHLAYAVGAMGYKVCLVELDPAGSLYLYTKILNVPTEKSTAIVLSKEFKGGYPLIPLWAESVPNVYAIQGGTPLERSIQEVYFAARRYYIFDDRLKKYPLDADLIIFDTPASLEPMGLVALAASTHILISAKPEFKDSGGFAGFLRWYYDYIDELQLTSPEPQIVGIIPSRVDLGSATHRNILGLDRTGQSRTDIDLEETLPYIAQTRGIKCYPPIRESNYFLSANGQGFPVQIFRPGCPATSAFEPITQEIINLITAT